MPAQPFAGVRLDPAALAVDTSPGSSTEFERLWRGFMTARVTLGLVLLLLQATLWGLGPTSSSALIFVCGSYFAAALGVRLFAQPRLLGRSFDPQWALTIGVDLVAFAWLQVLQGSNINYAPLLALPVLLAAVLGPLFLALGTAAAVSLMLLAYSAWLTLQPSGDSAAHFVQAALAGAGSFVIAFLANQLSTRLAQEEQRLRHSQVAVSMQQQLNELVIESLSDGILVVDARGIVRVTNPAARRMLGEERLHRDAALNLAVESAWAALANLARLSFSSQGTQDSDITIHYTGQGLRRLYVRTRLTATQGSSDERLCVMFLQDQREVEARIRTEKLAGMGRMSAAVAHEIRNPLAAIAQANALLDEDTTDPRQKQLTQMVAQNVRRLGKIVEEVLNISRVRTRENTAAAQSLLLGEAVARICRDWSPHTDSLRPVLVELPPADVAVAFEAEHLRRVLINLLDNARRYASQQPEAIQIRVSQTDTGRGVLGVWSDGLPLEQSVERHLFEPFFSSDSRSTGLGMYICRELCEGQGATIVYQRAQRQMAGVAVPGNEFFITFQVPPASEHSPGRQATLL